MADIDVGQLANSLTAQFQIFFQERRRREGDVKADERFQKQFDLSLERSAIARESEDRLARESEARIANRKVEQKQAKMAMFVDLFRQFGAEIGAKAAKAMGATPEELESLSTLVGIKAASRAPASSTFLLQAGIEAGLSLEDSVKFSTNPDSVNLYRR